MRAHENLYVNFVDVAVSFVCSTAPLPIFPEREFRPLCGYYPWQDWIACSMLCLPFNEEVLGEHVAQKDGEARHDTCNKVPIRMVACHRLEFFLLQV